MPSARRPQRRSRRRLIADVLTGLGLAGLLVLVSSTAPRWSRLLRQPISGGEDLNDVDRGAAPPTPTPPPSDVERTINVKLFFAAGDGSGLVIEERAVPFSTDLAQQIENVVAALVRGSQSGLDAPLGAETRVLGVFVSGRGVAYVNLSKEAQGGLPGGSRSELLAVYALVDTITANFPAVGRVQVLIEDRPADTLAGHIDLSRPLGPDMSLLAAAALTPVAPASPEAPPAGGAASAASGTPQGGR